MPIGPIEILLVFIVFIVLGPRRIANLFRSLGTGVHDFVETLGRDKDKEELPGERDDDRKS
jgi:sec-independent protein translocase protein TatA